MLVPHSRKRPPQRHRLLFLDFIPKSSVVVAVDTVAAVSLLILILRLHINIHSRFLHFAHYSFIFSRPSASLRITRRSLTIPKTFVEYHQLAFCHLRRCYCLLVAFPANFIRIILVAAAILTHRRHRLRFTVVVSNVIPPNTLEIELISSHVRRFLSVYSFPSNFANFSSPCPATCEIMRFPGRQRLSYSLHSTKFQILY